jgi:hypothetical protein
MLGLELARYAVAPGLGRNAAIETAKTATSDGTVAISVQIAGYRMVSFDPALTSVELAVRTGTGSYASGTVTLRWHDGDWRIVVDPATGQMTEVQPLGNLGGFTVWGAK